MGDRVEVYRARDGWRWRRVAANGRTIGTGEAHRRRWNAKRAARRVHPDVPVIIMKESPS